MKQNLWDDVKQFEPQKCTHNLSRHFDRAKTFYTYTNDGESFKAVSTLPLIMYHLALKTIIGDFITWFSAINSMQFWMWIKWGGGGKADYTRQNGNDNDRQIIRTIKLNFSYLVFDFIIILTSDLIYVLEKTKVKLFDWNKWLLFQLVWDAYNHINRLFI